MTRVGHLQLPRSVDIGGSKERDWQRKGFRERNNLCVAAIATGTSWAGSQVPPTIRDIGTPRGDLVNVGDGLAGSVPTNAITEPCRQPFTRSSGEQPVLGDDRAGPR